MPDDDTKSDPAPPSAPAPPLPKVSWTLAACAVGGVGLLVAVFMILSKADRADKMVRLGDAALFFAAAILIWEVVVAVAATLDPKTEKVDQKLADIKGASVIDISAIITAISGAPKWIGLAVVGVGLITFGLLIDGYRFADGGLTTTPAAHAAPTATAAPTSTAPTPTPAPGG